MFFLPFAIGWKLRWWPRNEFHWRWSIPVIALSLLVADYLYFCALREPAALVSVVMSLRRENTLWPLRADIVFVRDDGNGTEKSCPPSSEFSSALC